MAGTREPIGVVLAGGAGRRLGGGKACVELAGRPLARWVAEALGAVLPEVVVCARADSPLPPLGLPVWRDEPVAEPRHPLWGLAAALRRAGGRPVLTCPVDVPFVSPDLLRALLAFVGGTGGADGAPLAGSVAVADGQPLLGRFPAGCATALADAARAGAPVRDTVAALHPRLVAAVDPRRELFNVNTPDDLAIAKAMLRGG